MFPLNKNLQLIRNMGMRYVTFRIGFELKKKLGFFEKKFPQDPPKKEFISLTEWRKNKYFWGISREDEIVKEPSSLPDINSIFNGKIPFFSSKWVTLGSDFDWVTNPDTGYRYDPDQHWSKIQDYSKMAGDIKFVWEKSRFSYLYEIIRSDLFRREDHSEWVFNEIRSWLEVNKVNSGPNYRCSQEISLRILNWTYVLNFYKESIYLTEDLFQDMIHAIYWQLKHVYANINFSRIAVRNNHAITETLTLYLGALFYPFFQEAAIWKKKGKKWFEQEIAYQIYPDGTFLQFSMNYHRVVIQLLTWALKSADFFNERFDQIVHERAYKSLQFLFACQDEYTGWLPNYGSNDGALFFKLNDCDYRDYRPQLNTLHVLLTGKSLYGAGDWNEDIFWFKAHQLNDMNFPALEHTYGWKTFEEGGYFVLREAETLTFIRCGSHKDRPAQADNLHIDVWHRGKNVLFDGGSFKYNADKETLKYFTGTESHNTVMLNGHDQMLKGPRFIWYNWTQQIYAEVKEQQDCYCFEGTISAFTELKPGIKHIRKITKLKEQSQWIVEDIILGKPESIKMKQFWHILPEVSIYSKDDKESELTLYKQKGMRSDYYGVKNDVDQYVAETDGNRIISNVKIV